MLNWSLVHHSVGCCWVRSSILRCRTVHHQWYCVFLELICYSRCLLDRSSKWTGTVVMFCHVWNNRMPILVNSKLVWKFKLSLFVCLLVSSPFWCHCEISAGQLVVVVWIRARVLLRYTILSYTSGWKWLVYKYRTVEINYMLPNMFVRRYRFIKFPCSFFINLLSWY